MDFLSDLSANFLQVRPAFKLTDYKGKINRKEDWTSSPFLAFDGGYQLCLKVYPAGIGEGAGKYVSVVLYLMRGPHDDKLQWSGHWPLKGKFSVKLLLGRKHYSESLLEYTKTIDVKDTHRVTHNGMVKIGGVDWLALHSDITRRIETIMHPDDVYFRVQYNEDHISYRDIYTLSEQLNTHKLSLQRSLIPLHLSHSKEEVDDQLQVAPVTLQLSRFSAMMTGDTWKSSPFFAFIGGYQMCLKVVRVKDCLISSELFLMKGPHDDKLGLWPMKGTFTVQLFGNNEYYPQIYTSPDKERWANCFEQVTAGDMASEGFGFSIVTLDSSCIRPDFFEGDAMFFKVLYNKGTDL